MVSNRQTKQIHLAAHFPGVNNTTVWSDPRSGSQIDFDSFKHLAQTAERGKFDFFFLAEGLRLREMKGRIHDLDVVGRPESLTVLSALSAVTTHLGLAATVNSTFNEPYEVARRLASLDHLSGGRAAWNVVTSWDAFTGENFRRGGYLAEADRYTRAKEFLQTARELWDSWAPDALTRSGGEFVRPGGIGFFEHQGQHFDIRGQFDVPRPPQGNPVIIQAGDSEEGREFAASSSDVIFSRHSKLEEGRTFYRDVKSRLAKYGRSPGRPQDPPGRHLRPRRHPGGGRGTRRRDPPRPGRPADRDPVPGGDLGPRPVRLRPRRPSPRHRARPVDRRLQGPRPVPPRPGRDGGQVAGAGRGEEPVDPRPGHRDRRAARPSSAPPPRSRRRSTRFVQTDAADGFIFVPHITPGGLDDLVDKVVPLLQEKGVFRADYTGPTLRHHLGLKELA